MIKQNHAELRISPGTFAITMLKPTQAVRRKSNINFFILAHRCCDNKLVETPRMAHMTDELTDGSGDQMTGPIVDIYVLD